MKTNNLAAMGAGLLILGCAVGCDTATHNSAASPDGSGDVNVRTPATPSTSESDDVDVNVDLNGSRAASVNTQESSGVGTAETPMERREERRERIGQALDRVDVNVDGAETDVKVD